MALIKCPECNHEVSDKAVSCPHCGCPISTSNEKKIPVRFFYKKTLANTGGTIGGNVMVDGIVAGASNVGSDFEVMLTPGKHNVVIVAINPFTRAEQSTSETIEVPENAKKVNIEFGSKMTAMSLMGAVKVVIKNISIDR